MKKISKTNWISFGVLKLDLKMKLSALFVFVTLFTVHANDSYSQATKITLNMENVSIENIIDEIETSSFSTFFNEPEKLFQVAFSLIIFSTVLFGKHV